MGLFGGGNQTTEVKPWSGQRDHLSHIFGKSRNYFYDALNAGPYTGDFYAGLNGDQTDAMAGLRNFITGQGGQLAASTANAAKANAGSGANYGANADKLFSLYGGPATEAITGRIGSYMNEPVLQGQIDAAKRGVFRDLNENLMPASEVEAAMTGNLDSSRTGVQQGILQRGALEAAGDIEARMRGAAYDRALGAAQNDYFGGAELGLNANDQVGRAFAAGQAGAAGQLDLSRAMYDALFGVGAVGQANQQAMLDQDRLKHDYLAAGGWRQDALNRYLGTVGGANWGQEASGPSGPTTGQGVAGGALAGAGVGANFGPWGAAIGGGLGALTGLFS